VPGVPVTFRGTIANANPYPVVDGSLFVKIFRKTTGETQRNGNPVVDAFFAGEDLAVPANGNIPFSFEWQSPRYFPSGEYEAHFFFLVGKRFNLLGLSFTDDVTGNRTSFSVKSDAPEVPSFDKDAVSLNGTPYSFAAFAPHFSKDEAVNADVILVNPTVEARSVEIVWTLSNWSTESGSVLDTKTETVTLSPNERKSLRYVSDPKQSIGSVTVLRAEMRYRDTKSILGIRFVRDGFEEARLNFPGIMKYPVRVGETNTIFSCLHSTNAGIVKGGELILTLTDSFGTVLDTHTYRGDITGAMMGVKHDFTPKTSSSTFTLSTTLKKDGKTLETYETTYACEDIDSSLCPMNQESTPIISAKNAISSSVGLNVLFLFFLLIPIGLIVWFLLKRGKGSIASFAVLLALGSFASGGQAEAKSAVWSTNDIPNLYQVTIAKHGCSFGENNSTTSATLGLRNVSTSVAYGVSLYNKVTGEEILDGATVPVGTVIEIRPKRHENTDIYWNGTGEANDTPYGFWGKLKSSAYFQQSGDLVSTLTNPNISKMFEVFDGSLAEFEKVFPLVVEAPSFSVQTSGIDGLSCDASGTTCTVTAPGGIGFSGIFSQTSGRFYDVYDNCTGALRKKSMYSIFGTGWYLPYLLEVPPVEIAFSLTAIGGNNAPVAPTVTGNGGMVDTPLPFVATSTDPDSDQLRYGFDWDKDGSVDQWMPATGFVASGTAQAVSHAWIAEGSKAFQVLAEDSKGSRSAWTQHSVAVTVPSRFLTLCISGSKISPYSVSVGETRDVTAHYGLIGDCSDSPVTATGASFADSGTSAVSLNGTTLHADSVGSEKITASYTVGGVVLTDDALVTVLESSCTTNCTDSDPTGSGSPSDNENNLNWKEVQPGF
ncbi:MAG: hypothetical protein HGA33_03910, partial [Candidatus Moranbacteria bacterium]|nr:hypothetical protein [Candidatus Moranbacteria bacterium]